MGRKRKRPGPLAIDDDDDDDSNDEVPGLAPPCDLCPDALSRRVLKRTPSWYPSGPTTIAGVMDLPRTQVSELLAYLCRGEHGEQRRQNLMALLLHGIIISSCFSGAGTCEAVVMNYLSLLATALGLRAANVVFWSWTEDPENKSALKALGDHGAATKSLHGFGDIMDRLCKHDREHMVYLENYYLHAADCARDLLEDGLSTKVGCVEKLQKLASEFVDVASKYLGAVQFQTHAFCSVHGQMCPLSPRLDKRYRNHYWIDGSGSPCQAHSKMNAQHPGVLSHSTTLVLVYTYSMRFFEADELFHECVPGLPIHLVMTAPLQETEDVLKCAVRATDASSSVSIYSDRSLVFCVSDLGVPSNRRRIHANFKYTGRVSRHTLNFEDIFFKQVACDASIYLIPNECKSAGSLSEDLSSGRQAKAEGYLLKCYSREKEFFNDDGTWKHKVVLVNCQNVSEYGTIYTGCFPTMLCNSTFYDLVSSTPVSMVACWLAQGFPHPSAKDFLGDQVKFFPFPHLVGQDPSRKHLSIGEQKKLVGNTMHWFQMGAWFLAGLADGHRKFL